MKTINNEKMAYQCQPMNSVISWNISANGANQRNQSLIKYVKVKWRNDQWNEEIFNNVIEKANQCERNSAAMTKMKAVMAV
jgi:hypothetical protein